MNALILEQLDLYKRDEKLAGLSQKTQVDENNRIATYRFQVDAFEAGTPFFIEVEANGTGGNDTAGLVFIRKL